MILLRTFILFIYFVYFILCAVGVFYPPLTVPSGRSSGAEQGMLQQPVFFHPASSGKQEECHRPQQLVVLLIACLP